jgi:dCMP deaminase
MTQNKFHVAHMRVAKEYAKLSHATRLKVGCVIVKNDTIIGIGYNGMPSGWTNICEYEVYEEDLHTKPRLVTKPEVLHAETNAISKVARSTNSTEDADMFVTCAPCLDCAKLIHQSGIKRVFYGHTYRCDDGLEFLKECGIETQQMGDNNVV